MAITMKNNNYDILRRFKIFDDSVAPAREV